MTIRVLVVDDHPIFRDGLAALLNSLDDIEVVATAAARQPVHIEGLTVREREVLALIAEGAGNPQIARALGISVKTVQNYVSRILDKLQVSDRTQVALKARHPPV